MKHPVSRVNVFYGCGEYRLPTPVEPASAWYIRKGRTGNTTPAACLPFGKYSVCAYTGGYPAGYGVNMLHCGGPVVDKLWSEMPFIGLSHFHPSGTGKIGAYYNYAVTAPGYGPYTSFADAFAPQRVEGEDACPGYYAVTTRSVRCEATVDRRTAIHRYTFRDEAALATSGGRISINFANDGLYRDARRELYRTASGSVRILGAGEAAADVTLEGVTLHFRVKLSSSQGAALFERDSLTDGDELSFTDEEACGVTFTVREPQIVLHMAVSLRDQAHAAQLLCDPQSFDGARAEAYALWDRALSAVEIETDDPIEEEIFYSNLYQSLVKPCDLSGESFLAGFGDGPFVTDLATMWDMYKTELPLLLTLYPDISEKLLASFQRTCETIGKYPQCLILSSDMQLSVNQARMLADFTICDAYYRGIRADYGGLIDGAVRDSARFTDFFGKADGGAAEDPAVLCGNYASHLLDMAEASRALSLAAAQCGRQDAADYFSRFAPRWREAFSPDGMLRDDAEYYEGTRFNYSFRPLYEMEERIALCGADAFRAACLRFFGFTHKDDPLTCRFEAFNNETDMESPYVLGAAGLRRELYAVIRAGLDSMFSVGRGGLPGNNDSGGLSSCYLWNALGIFPMAGFDRMFLSVPRFSRAVLHLHNGNDLTIRREGDGDPVRVLFGGEDVGLTSFPVTDMMRGGELVFYTA